MLKEWAETLDNLFEVFKNPQEKNVVPRKWKKANVVLVFKKED